MTLAPLVIPEIRGVDGKPGELPRFCTVPGCISLSQHRHHLWPKSYLKGQPNEWVRVNDRVIQNTTGLCIRHHDHVTGVVGGGHLAHIRYNPNLQLLEWWEANEGDGPTWIFKGPLGGQALAERAPEAARARRQEGLCPTCGKPHSVITRKPGPKRKVKTWVVHVPDDSEKGADVLDVYIEDLAVVLGFERMNARLLRYHVLVPVLEWVNQSRAEFAQDVQEAEIA